MKLTQRFEFIYGVHPVMEAINSGRRRINNLLLLRNSERDFNEIEQIARVKKIDIKFLNRHELNRIVGSNEHQGIIAEVSPYVYAEMDELLENWAISGRNAFFLILDSIEDPHNLGAISRTALLCGVHGIFIPEHRSAKVTPAVCKASSGAVEHLKICIVRNLNNLILELKKHNVKIAGLAEEGDIELKQFDARADIALIIGSEGKGIGLTREKNCDFLIKIPTSVKGFSFNASVAAGIAMYEVMRQRAESQE
jgi:23S rRNA (guanosine2251-2'-O)-methyltransferase